MATLAEKRKEAKDLGIAATLIRSAENVRELQAIIDGSGKGKSKPKAAKKKAVAKKKSATKKSAAKKATTKKSNSKSTKSASSKTTPAKSTKKKGTAKRSSTAKAKSNSDSGRYTLDGVDYNETDGWNPRDGSAPDRIVKALKRFKGNRSKVLDFLIGDVWDFAGKKKRDGSKRTKAEAEAMLVYRIARTDWDFALKTGQHEKSDNRVEYGTGGTGAGTFKRAGAKKSTAKKSNSKKAGTTKKASGAKRGRPAGTKNKKAAARKAGKAAAKKNSKKK